MNNRFPANFDATVTGLTCQKSFFVPTRGIVIFMKMMDFFLVLQSAWLPLKPDLLILPYKEETDERQSAEKTAGL
jgi:hypothetical protein